MDCCASPGNDEEFTPAVAERTLRRWRRRGLLQRERRILEPVLRAGVADARVFEVGGGVGQLQVALLHAGAASATNLELAPAYEDHARQLLAEEGLGDRVERLLGDATVADVEVPEADVALAFRVLCCTRDWRGMADTLLRSQPRLLAVTLPRDGRLPRILIRAENLVHRLQGRVFRVQHDSNHDVVAHLQTDGRSVVHDDAGLFWRTVVLTDARGR